MNHREDDTALNDWQHHMSFFKKRPIPSRTHRKHPATPTACWPLSRSRPHIGSSRRREARPPQFATWSCACEWSSPSGYVKHRQSLLVAVDTRRHPVNAQRSLEINPVCMSILTTHTRHWHTHTHTHPPACQSTSRTHMRMHMHMLINVAQRSWSLDGIRSDPCRSGAPYSSLGWAGSP